MRKAAWFFLLAVWVLCSSGPASADLCESVQGKNPTAATQLDVDLHNELFPNTGSRGNRHWNEVVVQCNRKRDTKGNEIAKVTQTTGPSDGKKQLRSSDLDNKVIRGHYNFHGLLLEQQKYVYLLFKKGGVWTMIIPYKPVIEDFGTDRIDFFVGTRYANNDDSDELDPLEESDHGNAWQLYAASQVETRSVGGREVSWFKDPGNQASIAETLCGVGQVTYVSGEKGAYAGMNGFEARKRDPRNKHISLGRTAYAYDKGGPVFIGCRVKRGRTLYWQPDEDVDELEEVRPEDWILDNFERTAEEYWTIDGIFKLKLYLKGRNESEFSASTLELFKDNDHLTARFGTKFPPYGFNQMYKSNPVQYNNFSTMTLDHVYWHEVGHAFGLDDEYGAEKNKTGEEKANHCLYSGYAGHAQDTYIMCSTRAEEKRTIYPYLAVSRYVTKQNECFEDPDCGGGRYCDKGFVTVGLNQCFDKKADNASCDLVGGGHQCKGGSCRFSRCYTPDSVPLGGVCYVNAACDEGKCSSIDGTKGTCVCNDDGDCGTGSWCDGGLDFTKNACRPLKNDNETCAAVGGGHQCEGGFCAWSRCYTPNSVNMGGTCYVDAACKDGKCSSIDGTRGTCVCKSDGDCSSGSYCDSGVDLTKNVCRPLKNDNESCAVVGGGHQCKGGHCAWSRCYTPNGVRMGGTCYVDAACDGGKCSSIDGTKGTCVCKKDSDCGSGKWCDAGLDLKKNSCKSKLKKGAKCGSAGSFNNDRKCKSGSCSGFPNYKCN